jgi:hypothetical protein
MPRARDATKTATSTTSQTPLEVDLRPDVEVGAEWMIDDDQRPVGLEDEDEGRVTEAEAPDLDE